MERKNPVEIEERSITCDETVPCPFCQSHDGKFLYSVNDRINRNDNESFRIHECASCGIIFYTPTLSPEQLLSRYPLDYAVKTCSTGGWGPPQLYRMYKYRSYLRRLKISMRESNVLEIGCARGDLLQFFRRKGANVFGVEINKSDVAELNKKGIPVFSDVSEIIRESELRFDAVIASHIIEHLSDPGSELVKIYRVMKPGARLLVVTPNALSLGRLVFGRYWYGHQVPHHVFVFNKKNLSFLLENTGFEILSVKGIIAPNVLLESMGDLCRFGGSRLAQRFIAPFFSLNNILFLALFYMPAAAAALLGLSDIILTIAEKPLKKG